jgi:GNAT superfamily N-acetyltransferase
MLGQLGALLAVEPGAVEPGAVEPAPEAAAPTTPEAAPVAADHLVRTATPADQGPIHEFLETLAPELARDLPPAAELFLAEISGRVVGVAGWAPWDRDRSTDYPRGFDGLTLPDGDCPAEMTLLAVAPRLRGRGIGRGLASAVAGAAGAAGNTRVLAWTLADSDAHPSSVAARAFFRSNGFADLAVDRRIQALGEDRLLLSRPLG